MGGTGHADRQGGQHGGGQDLTGTHLAFANLTGADLTGANLTCSDDFCANYRIRGANLTNANLTNADLTGANLEFAILTGVTWDNTTCPDGSTTNTGCSATPKPGAAGAPPPITSSRWILDRSAGTGGSLG